MPRVRNILVDNTLGRVFSGTTSPLVASAANLIAGSVPATRNVATSSTTTIVNTNQLSGAGARLGANGGLITRMQATVRRASKGSALTITLKKGTTYASSTVVTTVTIAADALTGISSVLSTTLAAGEFVYLDASYPGVPTTRAIGLTIVITYYALP